MQRQAVASEKVGHNEVYQHLCKGNLCMEVRQNILEDTMLEVVQNYKIINLHVHESS